VHPARAFAYPPLLHSEPRQFLDSLTGHYLFAALHEFLCSSLMAENQQRVRHLEAAVRRITDETARIVRHCNRLRQEEITEEIEIILLSVEAPY
jgi:F-type H+-transporting ATPase subunit gamma